MFRMLSVAALKSAPKAVGIHQVRFAAKKAVKKEKASVVDVPKPKTNVKRVKASTATASVRRIAPHPTGVSIEFNTNAHRYTVKGATGHNLRSVTGLLRAPLTTDEGDVLPPVTHPFDMEGIALRVAEREGKTVDEVKKEWENIAIFGSKLHHFIYHDLTGEKLPNDVYFTDEELVETRPVAYQNAYFEYKKLLSSFGYSLYPGGSEMIVASLKHNLAGTIDCLMQCPEGNQIDPKPHLLLIDWKTNKQKLRGGRVFPGNPETLNWPFQNLPAIKTSEYALQTNCYRRILEIEGYLRKPMPIKMAIAQFIQLPKGKVEVDGISISELESSRISDLFTSSNTQKTKEARKKLPFSL